MSKIEREPKGGEFLPTRRAEWKNPILVATNFALDLSRRLGIIGKNGEFLDPERFQRLWQGCLVIATTMWDERGQPVTPWRVAVESLQQEGVINPGNRRIDRFSLAQLKLVEGRIGDLGQEMIEMFWSQEKALHLASQLRLVGEPLAVFSRGMCQRVDSLLRTVEEKIKPLKEYLKAHPQVRRAVLGTGSGLAAFLLIASFAPKHAIALSPGTEKQGEEPGKIHIVQPGETLWGIARKYGLPLSQLLGANPSIRNPNLIFPNQKLIIPSPENVSSNTWLRGPMLEAWIQNGGETALGLPRRELWTDNVGDTTFKTNGNKGEFRTVIECDRGWLVWNPNTQRVEVVWKKDKGLTTRTRGNLFAKDNLLDNLVPNVSYPVTIVIGGTFGWNENEAKIIARNVEIIIPELREVLGLDKSVVSKWREVKIQRTLEAGGYSILNIDSQGKEIRRIGIFDANDYGYFIHEWVESHLDGRLPTRAWQEGLAEYARVKLGGNWIHNINYEQINTSLLRGKSSTMTENPVLYTVAGMAWWRIEEEVKRQLANPNFVPNYVRAMLLRQNELGRRLTLEEALTIAQKIQPGAENIIAKQNILF